MSVEDYIIVKTPLGYLRGRKLPSARRDYYYSFQGIPYAKPPLGDLRFKVSKAQQTTSSLTLIYLVLSAAIKVKSIVSATGTG